MGRDSDASGGSANGGNGEGNSNEGRGGGRGGGGGFGGRNKDALGFNSLSPSRTSSGQAIGVSGARAGASGNSSTPHGLRSIADMQRGLSIAGPQLSRARDNAFATGLSYGLTALGMFTGFAGFTVASKMVSAARDYGRGYADRTAMEKAAAANGMGETQRGESTASGGLAGRSRPSTQAQAKAPAKAPASSNVGSGAAGATVIMGADKTRTGAGAGGRAKGSAVRGFGSSGLRI